MEKQEETVSLAAVAKAAVVEVAQSTLTSTADQEVMVEFQPAAEAEAAPVRHRSMVARAERAAAVK